MSQTISISPWYTSLWCEDERHDRCDDRECECRCHPHKEKK